MADIDALREEAANKQAAAEAAVQEHQDAVAAIDNAIAERTATFRQEIVDEARSIEINPDNFEDESGLQQAINRRYEEHPELRADTNFTDETDAKADATEREARQELAE
jgi:hypothetical protein